MIDKNNEIRECRNYMDAISIAINKLLEINSIGSKKSNMRKQMKLFEKLRNTSRDYNKFLKQFKKYKKSTEKNLKKVSRGYFSSSKIRDFLESKKSIKGDIISKVMANFTVSDDLFIIIDNLSKEYKVTLNKIQDLKKSIEDDKIDAQKREQELQKRMEEYNKPKPTIEELEKQRKKEELDEYNKTIEYNSGKLLDGPKNASLIDMINGKDVNVRTMGYLYGLAADIILLMSMDQRVNIKNEQHGDNARIWNADFHVLVPKEARTQLLSKYGVTSIDGLLNKYEQIRKKFYKKYSKLSNEKQQKYSIENFDEMEIESSLVKGIFSGNLFYAMKNENFKFPPSKEKLIEMINSRIMNGKNYELVAPKREEVITAEPEDYQRYNNVKQYYKNLTKNMTIEEVSELYKHVVMDMHEGFRYSSLDPQNIKAYYAVMQKLFCEVIFDKKGKEFLDPKQQDQAIKEIAETILKEQLDFSIYGSDKVTEEEQEKRDSIMMKEYSKYRAGMKNKKDTLSYNEFCKQKYGIINGFEPKNMEEMIEEEIKGMKK